MLIQMVVHLVLILFWPSDVLLERFTIRVHQELRNTIVTW